MSTPEGAQQVRVSTENTEGPPIFVIGNGRSGTTLMELMLSAHPRIYICHEVAIYGWQKAGIRFTADEFLRGFFKTLNFRWLRLKPETVLEGLPVPLQHEDVWMVFERIMKLKAASFGRVRYGDKTPGHTPRLEWIFRDFPEAKVVFMVRDPRGIMASISRMPWGAPNDLPNCWINEKWHRKAEKYSDKILTVRLEDLQADPRGQMERVLEYVGEEWDEAVLDHPNHIPDPDCLPDMPWFKLSGRPIQPQDDPWKGMNPARVRLVEHVCRETMDKYGYERADIKDAPGRLGTAREYLRQLPETGRYAKRLLKLLESFQDPDRWDWEDLETREVLKGMNPQCWRYYPDYEWPPSPEPLEIVEVPAGKAG